MNIASKRQGTRSASKPAADLDAQLSELRNVSVGQLHDRWRGLFGSPPPASFTKDLLVRAIAYRLQEKVFGGLDAATRRVLRALSKAGEAPRQVKVGSIIVREHRGVLHEVMVVPGGFCWAGRTYDSLSIIAREITGVRWNGPRFFGLRTKEKPDAPSRDDATGGKATSTGLRPQGGTSSTGGRRSTIGARSSRNDAR